MFPSSSKGERTAHKCPNTIQILAGRQAKSKLNIMEKRECVSACEDSPSI